MFVNRYTIEDTQAEKLKIKSKRLSDNLSTSLGFALNRQ